MIYSSSVELTCLTLINKLNLNAVGICTGEAFGDMAAMIVYVCILVRKLTNGPQLSERPNSNYMRQVLSNESSFTWFCHRKYCHNQEIKHRWRFNADTLGLGR